MWEKEWFDNVRTASTLKKRPKMTSDASTGNENTDPPEMTQKVEQAVKENLAYYEELYKLRITAETTQP